MASQEKKKTQKTNNKLEFDYEKLAEAIVKAQNKSAKIIEKEKEELDKKDREEWNKIFNYIEIDKKNNIFIRILLNFINDNKFIYRIIFFKREQVSKDRVTAALMKMLLIGLFRIINLLLYFACLVFIMTFVEMYKLQEYSYSIISLLCLFVSFILTRILRICSFEIEKIHDGQYLFNIVSSLSGFLALIVSIIDFFVNR